MNNKKGKKLPLYHKILIGIVLGVPFGIIMRRIPFLMTNIDWIRLPGEIFLSLIVMIVAPLVFASITAGTASLGDIKKLGRIGGRTIAYFMITTVIAITIGLIAVNIIKPGMKISQEDRINLITQYKVEVDQKLRLSEQKPRIIDMIRDIIPINPFLSLSGLTKAEADGVKSGNTMLQIIFFALLFGVTITLIKEHQRKMLIELFEAVSEAMIALVNIIMRTAPIGVFSLIAVVVAGLGLNFLGLLLIYALTVIIGLAAHILITYNFVLTYIVKMKSFEFFKKISPVMLVAFSTCSSNATLPVSMKCAEEELKVKKEITSFVLPLGATINMDGTALYQAVAAVFIAQVFGMNLDLVSQLTIIFTATLASIGTPGVPSVGIVMLIMVLKSVNVPVVGIALILGIDRILDMCRTTLNVTGDLTATVFNDKFEKKRNR